MKSVFTVFLTIFVLLIVFSFGAYPKLLNLKDTKSILLETRNYECMSKVNSNRSKCPNVKTNIDNQTEVEMLTDAFNIVWCSFSPLSFEGSPYYKVIFKSSSGVETIINVKGNQISSGCWLPKAAEELLNDIANRLNLNAK